MLNDLHIVIFIIDFTFLSGNNRSIVTISTLDFTLKIEILCTGDEILSGKTVNTNYSHLARRLTELGFQTYWGTVVGDNADSLLTAFTQASERADAVIVNGGLGPTVDDLTQEIAAQAAGKPLQLNHYWLNNIKNWYHKNGRSMPVNNLKQAMLPEGSELIDNPIGTACGFALTINHARFFFTPGVPREFKQMIENEILPRLQQMRGISIYTRVKRFHSFGIGESRADRLLLGIEDMSDSKEVKLGFQSHFPQLETKLTISDTNTNTLEEKLKPLENEVRARFGNFIISEDNESLGDVIIQGLKSNDRYLTIAETGTAGGVQARLIESNSNNSVVRGYTASSFEELSKMLNHSDPGDLLSEQTAKNLLANLCLLSSCNLGMVLQLTQNNAKPNENNSATLIVAMGNAHNTTIRKAILPGRKGWTKTAAIELSLDCLRRFLYKLPVYEKIDFEQH